MSVYIENIIGGIKYRIHKSFSNSYKKVGLNLFTVKKLKHSSYTHTRSVGFLNSRIYFRDGKEFLYGLKEIFIDEIYRVNLPDNSLVIDCGANIGLSVIYFAKLNPSAKIIAYEPDNDNFELLKKNTNTFKLNNVELRKEAVWVENTELKFKSDGSMGSKIINSQNNDDNTKTKAIRLKEILNQPVEMLKMDIEGAEFEVIKDIQDKLYLIKNLFIEYHGSYEQNSELTEMFNILIISGFKYYIKEAAPIYKTPFIKIKPENYPYDIQLNIFCFKK